jgi:excisionase family DNA binding protein
MDALGRFNPEKQLTIKEASSLLGVPYWKLLRAVNRGDVPSYKFFNSRKLVRLSEILAIITASPWLPDLCPQKTDDGGNSEHNRTRSECSTPF